MGKFFHFGWVFLKFLPTTPHRATQTSFQKEKGSVPLVIEGGANLCFKFRQPEPGGIDLGGIKKAGPPDSRSNLKILCCVAPAARSSKK